MIGPRKVDKPLVLYGYGKLGHLAEEIFKELKINITLIMDKAGIAAISSPFLKRNALVAICVATEPYSQIIAPLQAAGWTDIVPVWDIIEAYPEVGLHNGWFAPKLSGLELEELLENTEFVYQRLAGASRISYHDFLNWRYDHTDYELRDKPLPSLPSTLADIRARQHIDIMPYVPTDSVSVHNEGHEYDTLRYNIRIWQQWRPDITVACYHSSDSLWKIEKFLMDNLPDYRWEFRLTAYMGQGAYLYGCPKEKLDK